MSFEPRLRGSRREFLRVASQLIFLNMIEPKMGSAKELSFMRYGVNFSVVDIDKTKIGQCTSGDHSATISGRAFLPNYQSRLVRDSVNKSLMQMKAEGVSSIRSLIWFAEKASSDRNTCGINQGREIGANLRLFAEDLARAGMGTLIVAFSPQARSAPICRQKNWGDCFEEQTLANSGRFIADVRQSFASPYGIDVWFDLNNEGVPANSLPKQAKDGLIEYMRNVSLSQRSAFPSDRLSMSMQASSLQERMRYLLDNFDSQGVGPNFYSLHLYKSSSPDPESTLLQFAELVRARPRPVFIGEVEDDPAYFLRVKQVLERSIPEYLESIVVWPLRDSKNQCAIDTEPSEVFSRIN